MTGDSHAHLLERLERFAGQLGYELRYERLPGALGGYCDPKRQVIVIDAAQAANGQVRTAIHEFAHALGVGYDPGRPSFMAVQRAQRLSLLTYGRDLYVVPAWRTNVPTISSRVAEADAGQLARGGAVSWRLRVFNVRRYRAYAEPSEVTGPHVRMACVAGVKLWRSVLWERSAECARTSLLVREAL